MADHRALQILAALVSNIGTSTSAGTNVYRNPGRQLPDSADLAIAVAYGSDSEPDYNSSTADSWLTVFVDLLARDQQPLERESGAVPDYEAALLGLRKEVHINIMSDITQGLAFVIDTESQGAGEIDYGPDAEHVLATMRTVWRIKYRTSVGDPSQ